MQDLIFDHISFFYHIPLIINMYLMLKLISDVRNLNRRILFLSLAFIK